ncbi:MAG TPA: hypothetical protein VEK15_23045 [Vicinamibacteria bacterium]|nr:hypothetical protein [Vicinamibacteria bacterium]
MDNGSMTWVGMLISWAPILIGIGFLVVFMRKYGQQQQSSFERNLVFMERVEQLLERIAVAVEDETR